MKVTIQTTVGLLDVEITFMPADPDSGFPEPYIDDWEMYYAGTLDKITRADDDALMIGEEMEYIKTTFLRELNEQAAIAQVYSRGAEWD